MGDTEPKVKPLVAFAAVVDGDLLLLWSVRSTVSMVKGMVELEHPGGWSEAERLGYRIIKVRIEPVEE